MNWGVHIFERGSSKHALATLRFLLISSLLPKLNWGVHTKADSHFNGLAEFVTRRGRVELVEFLLGEGFSIDEIAVEVGVSGRAVYKWVESGETHPSNRSLVALLELALKVRPSATLHMLAGEASEFARLVERVAEEI